MIGTYYTITLYNNGTKCWCMAYKSRNKAYAELEKLYAQSVDDMRFGQILKVEKDLEITDEYDEEGNIIVKRGRKKEPKMLGFDCLCKGGIKLEYCLDDAEGDIEELELADRFSD